MRIACGDWERVLGPSVRRSGVCGVFLDPPYATGHDLYAATTDGAQDVALQVRQWAIDHADDDNQRIVLAGYAGEYDMPAGWTAVPWKGRGGATYASAKLNNRREVLWCSPQCLPVTTDRAPSLALEEAS